ncbi:hypothetical protein OTC26_005485 [Streptomyces tirandamycinicus]|uniref:hypothetical protein n=1 Tax=Streptomyces tirandamycinicus TaxID=2174846 RepID=UPI0003768930|nr:hypothetical protein [Streptomyces tirandamycinicus]MCY0984705.1 hypothetical protein [Streptomyces tirandamycinicus]
MRPDAQQAVPPAAAAVDGSGTHVPPADRFLGMVLVRPRVVHGTSSARAGHVPAVRVPAAPGHPHPLVS